MLKVIELDIDPEISGETGVWEVAWVEMPAIEQELIYFSEQRFFKAPEYVSETACRAIRENEKRGNPAATQVGKIRGQQLCNRSEISLETVKRMKSYLERAKTYYTGDYDDNGTISYDLWGGEEALKWVDTILKSEQKFIYPNAGESKDEFLPRCMGSGTMVSEYPREDQRYAVCQSYYERRDEFQSSDNIGFDWRVLKTDYGVRLFENEMRRGSRPVIFVQGLAQRDLIDFTNKYRIPVSNINSYTTREEKVDLIQKMGLPRHYDDDFFVRGLLGDVAVAFDYETGGLPPYTQYPTTGATNAMLVEPILPPTLFEDCGCSKESMAIEPNPCWEGYEPYGLKDDGSPNCIPVEAKKQEFDLVGYIDGQPVFSSPQEAEAYGENQMGCSGHHTHTDENGNEVYMACEMHPEVQSDMGVELEDLIAKGWKIESIGSVQNIEQINEMAKSAFSKITREEFYQIKSNPNGFSALDQPGGNKIRFIYAVGPGMGAQLIKTSRDFCKRMLGGRQFVFRYEDILELNAQLSAEDGSSRKIIPRPKGTNPDIFQWKGGANCRHIWIQLIFSSGTPDEGYDKEITNDKKKMEREAALVSPSAGQGGNVNPKARTVRGDRMEAFASELMPEYWEDPELIPVGYIQGLPIFDNIVDAQDASYFLNCGGVTEEVEFMGTRKFQACSYSAKKAEKQEQIFKSIDEKRMVYTPLMIPNILIPRLDDITGERYFVKFKPEVIQKIQQKFMIEQRLRETNYEHTDQKFSDIVMVESWIVEGDSDKAYSLGFSKEQIPVGSWMAGYKFLDSEEADMVWENYVKKGKVKGASVEGNFILNFSRVKKDEYLLLEIINILKDIN
jgi:hypothetical protein